MEGSLGTESEDKTETPVNEEPEVQTAFMVLEQGYRNVLAEMEKMEGLEHFSEEFTNLFEALFHAHEHEAQLITTIRDLQNQVTETDAKLVSALKLSATEKQTIEQLKQEVESGLKMVDTAHAREQIAQETIETLRHQVSRLNQELEQMTRGMEQAEEYGALAKNKEGLLAERERLISEVSTSREALEKAQRSLLESQSKNDEANKKITVLDEQLVTHLYERDRESRYRTAVEEELARLRADLVSREEDLQDLKGKLDGASGNAKTQDRFLREHRKAEEKMKREIDSLRSQLTKTQTDFQAQLALTSQMHEEALSNTAYIKGRDDEISRLRKDLTKAEKKLEIYSKRLQVAEHSKSDVVRERDKVKAAVLQLERELELAHHQAEADHHTIESLTREKEVLGRNIVKAAAATQQNVKLLRLQEQVRQKLEIEIDNLTMDTTKRAEETAELQKKYDRCLAATKELTGHVEDALEEVRMRQVDIFDCKKQIAEGETKFRQQQNLFEAVRTDRNTFSKQLLEAQDEIMELKQKLKVISHQVEQLKEDVSAKERQLLKGGFDLMQAQRDGENYRLELQASQQEVREWKARMEELRGEERRLQIAVADADVEKQHQQKEMEQILNERDILGTQLVRRNDELTLLYEKIRILQNALHRGEAQYDQRLEDIRLLKVEIKRLRQEKALLVRSMDNVVDLRQEVFHLERDLTRERLKCRALEEELQNPLNVHRWRKLEGYDPKMFELITKIQLLQKRLVAQSNAALIRERQLRASEELYLELRRLLARQPGPETAMRLVRTQRALQERGRKMRCLVSELTASEARAAEYRVDLQRATHELRDVKSKYYSNKRREQTRSLPAITAPATSPVNNSRTRFVGGGFNLGANPTK